MFSIQSIPEALTKRENASLLNSILRGVEREALRVSPSGELSQKRHPQSLGSTLTHPLITTDFSEALLEFITPPTHRLEDLFQHLESVHRFTTKQLGDELLWTNSMPCSLPEEKDIPVGQYGNSHNGRLKTIYRLGLGLRYGRSMQTVSGIHYNFSLPTAFWAHFHAQENSLLSLESYRNKRYFDLIRNFRRHYWALILLFGASPAMCSSFVKGREHNLDVFDGNKALYRPYATSLRMGDLGYQSSAQENLFVCYNEKSTYIKTLANAILKPYEGYQNIPLKDGNGNYQQLSQGLLQIENEFYSAIRPKRSAKPGETALTALHRRGVEYIEVRCLDVNPFSELGITEEQVCFLDVFLLYCALKDSPVSGMEEGMMMQRNQKRVVNEGRKPGLMLEHVELGEIAIEKWLDELLIAMEPVAELLDKAYENTRYSTALNSQKKIANDLSQTPSARLLRSLEEAENYRTLSLSMAKRHTETLRNSTLDEDILKRFHDTAEESHAEQSSIEASCDDNFDAFLKNYFKQYESLLK
jgi:glutamate--cysteine ligase